jgi:thiamine-monophosphate kinase
VPVRTIASIGERGLIERLQGRLPSQPDFVRVGIGDDAAVLSPERGTDQVVTTDGMVEGVHFRRDWTPADAIGHKALAVNLSDLAAMGAQPRAALLSLAMPADFPLDDFDGLIDGFVALATRTRTTLVGGNLTRSPGPLFVEVTAIGAVRPRRLLQRAGAKVGDRLYVTGHVGAAAAGLGFLSAGRSRRSLSPPELVCLNAYERPEPRLRLASLVAKTGAASAAIDLSDGLGDAAVRLAEAGRCGLNLDATAIPVAAGARSWFDSANRDPVESALAGGEDYELAFAVSKRQERRFLAAARRCPDVPATKVGEFVAEPGVRLVANGTVTPVSGPGFGHF